jgi:hypothetical protein
MLCPNAEVPTNVLEPANDLARNVPQTALPLLPPLKENAQRQLAIVIPLPLKSERQRKYLPLRLVL